MKEEEYYQTIYFFVLTYVLGLQGYCSESPSLIHG